MRDRQRHTETHIHNIYSCLNPEMKIRSLVVISEAAERD